LQRLNASGGPPLETLPPLEARAVLAHAQASSRWICQGIAESEDNHQRGWLHDPPEHRAFPQAPQAHARVHLYSRRRLGAGRLSTHKRMVRDLVVLSGVPGVFVNYTRTPEARYPQAVKEIYAATKVVAAHGEEIGVDGPHPGRRGQ